MLLDSLRTEAEADFKLLTDSTSVKKEEWIKKILTCCKLFVPLHLLPIKWYFQGKANLVLSSPQMPFFVYEVSISFGVTKDDLHKFVAILPQIQKSKYSGTLKNLDLVVVVAAVVFVKFQMFIFVNFVHTVKILANEKTECCYIENIEMQKPEILYANGIGDADTSFMTWKGCEGAILNFSVLFSVWSNHPWKGAACFRQTLCVC